MNEIEKAKEILNEYNQIHIVNLFDKIDEEKQVELAKQVLNIDFHKMAELYENTKKEIEIKEKTIEPIKYLDKAKLTYEEKQNFDNLGIQAVKNGEYAVVTMAGGQGTRLGHSGPKGTFKLNLNPEKSIFEILTDSLKANNEKYNVIIPWYIMTSRENNEMTKDFLEKNNYFGYDPKHIYFFKQGELPMCSEDGKLLIDET